MRKARQPAIISVDNPAHSGLAEIAEHRFRGSVWRRCHTEAAIPEELGPGDQADGRRGAR
jgi:hypothetical protein